MIISLFHPRSALYSQLLRGLLASLMAIALVGAAPAQWQTDKLSAPDTLPGDEYGRVVAISGDTALIGAQFDDDMGNDTGTAYIMVRDALGNWTEQAQLYAGDPSDLAQFGNSVALDGDTALVGAWGDGGFAGAAYVFERDALGEWSQTAKLSVATFSNITFGVSLSLDGDRALIGAPTDDVANSDSGSAYVFVRNPGGSWTEETMLFADDGDRFDQFGKSVSLSGDTALVGAWQDDDPANNTGSAYVFVRDGGGNWTQQQKLSGSDTGFFHHFGTSVGLLGDTALVGAPFYEGSTGAAYVFVRDGGGTWTEQGKLTASDGEAVDSFGFDLALSDDKALIGAAGDDDGGMTAGSAYLFSRDGMGLWSEQNKLTPDDPVADLRFGGTVAISGETALIGTGGPGVIRAFAGSAYVFCLGKLTAADAGAGDIFGSTVSVDGNTALIGAPRDDEMGDDAGAAYVYAQGLNGGWVLQAKLTAEDAAAGDEFGGSVSLSGRTALIAAQRDDDAGTSSGSAYVFLRDAFGHWTQQEKLTASDAAPLDQFGGALSLDGDTALVGTVFDENLSGAAYIFVRDGAGNWSEQQKLTAADAAPQSVFGRSLSLDGNTALIGASQDDNLAVNSGAAYVFVRDALGNWTQQDKLLGEPGIELFGSTVSLSGDTAMVGNPAPSLFGSDPGAVYVFVRDALGDWTQEDKLQAADNQDNNFFGAVSLNSDLALIGAPGDGEAGMNAGAAYLFQRDGSGKWNQIDKYTATADADDRFGTAVSLSGQTLLIGASGDAHAGDNSGSAYLLCGSTGAFASFGAGCQGTVGVPVLSSRAGEVASIGDAFVMELRGLPVDGINVPLGIRGTSKTQWGPAALPLDASPFGFFGCTLYVNVRQTYALTNLAGRAIWMLAIPDVPEFVGESLFFQAGVIDFGANAASFVLSNAGEVVVVSG